MTDPFATVAEQEEAKTLLRAALTEGVAHAYLFHGPAGVGKRRTALLFAAELLGDLRRVEQGSHPDLFLLEPVGDQIRIDEVRALRRDLHMRPYEASKRVYLIFSAETMNREAADALLKDQASDLDKQRKGLMEHERKQAWRGPEDTVDLPDDDDETAIAHAET